MDIFVLTIGLRKIVCALAGLDFHYCVYSHSQFAAKFRMIVRADFYGQINDFPDLVQESAGHI